LQDCQYRDAEEESNVDGINPASMKSRRFGNPPSGIMIYAFRLSIYDSYCLIRRSQPSDDFNSGTLNTKVDAKLSQYVSVGFAVLSWFICKNHESVALIIYTGFSVFYPDLYNQLTSSDSDPFPLNQSLRLMQYPVTRLHIFICRAFP